MLTFALRLYLHHVHTADAADRWFFCEWSVMVLLRVQVSSSLCL